MGLQQFWFVTLGVLFCGFLVLEGFDFGVGMLMAPLGRAAHGDPEAHRRAVLNTIGPVLSRAKKRMRAGPSSKKNGAETRTK